MQTNELVNDSLLGDNQSNNPIVELVGEDKKFKTVEDLAKGKLEADRFIEQLKQENAGLREDLTKRLTLEQVMEKINSMNSETRGQVNNVDLEDEPKRPVVQPHKLEDIVELVKKNLTQEQQREAAAANIRSVKEQLQKHFGSEDKYRAKMQETLRDLGMDAKTADSLAATSPKAFLAMVLGSKSQDAPQADAPPKNQLNSAAIAVGNPGSMEKYEDFEKLRKTNPAAYWSPAVQNKLFKAAAQKGPEFLYGKK